jgi:hypothetical protein
MCLFIQGVAEKTARQMTGARLRLIAPGRPRRGREADRREAV